MNLDIGWEAE